MQRQALESYENERGIETTDCSHSTVTCDKVSCKTIAVVLVVLLEGIKRTILVHPLLT